MSMVRLLVQMGKHGALLYSLQAEADALRSFSINQVNQGTMLPFFCESREATMELTHPDYFSAVNLLIKHEPSSTFAVTVSFEVRHPFLLSLVERSS